MSFPVRKPEVKPRIRTETEVKVDSLLYFQSSLLSLDALVYPLRIYYRDIEIRILEVMKVENKYLKEYFVVVQLKRGNITTKPFTISCTDVDDFIKKLRSEIIKFRVGLHAFPDIYSKI